MKYTHTHKHTHTVTHVTYPCIPTQTRTPPHIQTLNTPVYSHAHTKCEKK